MRFPGAEPPSISAQSVFARFHPSVAELGPNPLLAQAKVVLLGSVVLYVFTRVEPLVVLNFR